MATAAAAGVGELQKELICPICLDFFDDPVILKCGHNFCRGCILMHWEENGDDDIGYHCPECRQVFGKISFTTNYLVKNLVDKLDGLEFLKSGKPTAPVKPTKLDSKCDKHGEELKLYCHTDSKPICVVCRESRAHRHHDVAPLPEVIDDMKRTRRLSQGELRLKLIKLTWQKSLCERVKSTDEAAKADTKRKKQDLKRKIENDIGALVQFLLDEKEDILASLEAEEVATVAMIDENLKDVSKEMAAVDKAITDIQNHLSGKSTFEAISQTIASPFQVSSPLQATNCPPNWEEFNGPLQLIMWKKMMHVLHTVPANLALDMDTAHPGLQVGDFDTKVEEGQARSLEPDLPQRFTRFLGVLATAQFSSGQHYWEVDVRDKGVWYLGVTTEYSNRKGYVNLSPSAGYWSLCLQDRLYANEEDARLSLADYWNSPRVGVYLDYERGRVSFYDAVAMKHVYTFEAYFDEPVFPFFSPGKNDPGSRLQLCHYY
ncbi:E3 ubiquitin-protein ligase TRIM47 isoform X1 [Anguilla anguilla]|uniref:E3 ubiquitin-protein ligase TRIM47 isoform X1 n=1 Tax=Anguilla anguilla TaxID=7936 RepID=UPI0015AFED63|nr:E3 ubiquitin-protein ligase TRIM47 isoform X1 [Anguilla anguilla]